MAYLSDLLVAAAALGAAFYCFILSRRLQALTRLDGGLGSAIALLSAQVDDLSRTLHQAREGAESEAAALDEKIARAEAACGRLDLLLASLHDLPREGSSSSRTMTGADMPESGMGGESGREAGPSPRPGHDSGKTATRARIIRRRQPMEPV